MTWSDRNGKRGKENDTIRTRNTWEAVWQTLFWLVLSNSTILAFVSTGFWSYTPRSALSTFGLTIVDFEHVLAGRASAAVALTRATKRPVLTRNT